uniref:protein-tyrosine-phosphatase n=1 Tax=Sinocyclocheilus anshuiensis TaxID=1608454 RepID=A0A671M1B7_9TELE
MHACTHTHPHTDKHTHAHAHTLIHARTHRHTRTHSHTHTHTYSLIPEGLASLCVILQRIPEDFNVFQLIQEMRTHRHSAVQTKEQYELVHRAIAQLFEKQLMLLESPTNSELTDGMEEGSPEKSTQNSDEERWDTPPPKPPRIRSNQVEGDLKEEILQPPEPRPVPPILTPSPPSAFPTVTNVRQDNDRYHPKPILHVLRWSVTAFFAPDCDDSEDLPPPVPERTAESFLMATGASLLCPATRGQQRL